MKQKWIPYENQNENIVVVLQSDSKANQTALIKNNGDGNNK